MIKYLYCLITLIAFTSLPLNAQHINFETSEEEEKYWLAQDYIASFKHFAIEEMHKTGIPASITLAQGLHESNYGRSRLATLANNHFGAKAHNTWVGPVLHHDDDAPQEAFRKYATVEHSYRDHSKVLAKKRYAFLYHLNPYDYKAWSHGLKKAGYATDPNYAFKLIKIIENYELHIYDSPTYNEPEIVASITPTYTKQLTAADAGYMSASYTKPIITNNKPVKVSRTKKKRVHRKKHEYETIVTKAVSNIGNYQTPEQKVELAIRAVNKIERPLTEWHKGNKAVFFETAMMPSEVSFWYNVSLDKLLKWNYTKAHIPFKAGKPVYLEALRNKGGSLSDKAYIAQRGQTLIDIALISGIKLERLMKINKVKHPENFVKKGEKVNLKRKRRKKLKTESPYHYKVPKQLPKIVVASLLNKRLTNYTINEQLRKFTLLSNSYYQKQYKEEVVVAQKPVITKQVTYTTNYKTNNSYNNSSSSQIASVNNSSTAKPYIFDEPITKPVAKPPKTKPIYHKVKKGETLYRLSVIYDVYIDDIKTLNNLSDNTIKVGTSVRIK